MSGGAGAPAVICGGIPPSLSKTPKDPIELRTDLLNAIKSRNVKLCLLLLNEEIDLEHEFLLTVACAHSLEPIAHRLIAKGANVNAVNESGSTPLLQASRTMPSVVDELLTHGANPNIASKLGNTPLLMACKYLNEEIAMKLIDAGASVNTANTKGHTPRSVCDAERMPHLHERLMSMKAAAGTPLHPSEKIKCVPPPTSPVSVYIINGHGGLLPTSRCFTIPPNFIVITAALCGTPTSSIPRLTRFEGEWVVDTIEKEIDLNNPELQRFLSTTPIPDTKTKQDEYNINLKGYTNSMFHAKFPGEEIEYDRIEPFVAWNTKIKKEEETPQLYGATSGLHKMPYEVNAKTIRKKDIVFNSSTGSYEKDPSLTSPPYDTFQFNNIKFMYENSLYPTQNDIEVLFNETPSLSYHEFKEKLLSTDFVDLLYNPNFIKFVGPTVLIQPACRTIEDDSILPLKFPGSSTNKRNRIYPSIGLPGTPVPLHRTYSNARNTAFITSIPIEEILGRIFSNGNTYLQEYIRIGRYPSFRSLLERLTEVDERSRIEYINRRNGTGKNALQLATELGREPPWIDALRDKGAILPPAAAASANDWRRRTRRRRRQRRHRKTRRST